MHTDLDSFIETLAQAAVNERDFGFASHREAQHYLAQTRQKIREGLEQGSHTLIKGLQTLSQHQGDHIRCYVAGIARKLLKNLGAGKQLNRIIEQELIGNDHALRYFCETAGDFSQSSDYEVEACVLSVLLAFFSGNAQPYVYFGTMLWRREGIAVAERFYSKIVEVIHDPALDYFAADCLLQSNRRTQARALLQQSLQHERITSHSYRQVRQDIISLMARCQD